MAGAGAKLFTSGSVLTASDVNTYLMDQTIMKFTSTTTRDAAFGGAGEPTLAEGMFAYTTDTNTLWLYDGASWVSAVNASSLNGVGTYQTYTPIFAGVTVGNGTRSFRYTQIGKFVHYQGSFTFGTTSSIAGTCAIFLPVAPKTEGWSCCVTQLQDTGVSTLMGSGNIIGNYVYVYVNASSGTYVTPNGLTTTVPFTWGNTDQITLDMVYEAA
jgi:hypothetical protein